ncbi:uncharacterized protein TNCV_2524801 [Trichonephila clavipes]|nr:uncharacterized protein TNCV_2524801 [Trichonephila clavipes]
MAASAFLMMVANGTMTGQRYIDEVLLLIMFVFFRGAVAIDKFVFLTTNHYSLNHRTLAVQSHAPPVQAFAVPGAWRRQNKMQSVLPARESVARVAAIVGDHRCHTPRYGFKETLDVFLRYSRPSSLHTLPKLIWCGSWGCNMGQPLSNHGPHVFYRRKIRRASRPGKQFNLVINEEPLDNACHMWSRIILLKYGCGQALKVRKANCLQYLGNVALAV